MVIAIARRRAPVHALPFALFYGVRWLIQRVVYLPIIMNSAWEDPGVPSLVIFYDQVHDLFPSGHVGFVLLCYLYHSHRRIGEQTVARLALVNIPYQAFVVVASRTHYSIDVIGGLLLAYSIWCMMRRILFPCKMRGRTLRVVNVHDQRLVSEAPKTDAATSTRQFLTDTE